MAEPTDLISEGYRWGVLGAVLLRILTWLLPRGYRFRWIRLYAERDTQQSEKETDDETETQ